MSRRNSFIASAAGTALVYSTYLGGNGGNEYGMGIAVDTSSNVYVTGATNSTNFPGISGSSFQSTYGGYWRDGFATKINSAGNAIVYSTYLGGSGDDIAWAATADSSGNGYFVGTTYSTNFPTANALTGTAPGGGSDAFLVKIGSTGTVAYSTYIGGTSGDSASDVNVDGSGNVYVVGGTGSSDFPTTVGAFQTTMSGTGDGFIYKINSTGTALSYSTFFGGSTGDGIGVSTLDSSGNVYIGGNTEATSFPGSSGSSIQSFNAGGNDIWVAKLNAAMSSVTWATFLGGTDFDQMGNGGLAVDSSGNVYVGGATLSTTFTGVTGTSMQPSSGGDADAVYAKINAAGTSITWAAVATSATRWSPTARATRTAPASPGRRTGRVSPAARSTRPTTAATATPTSSRSAIPGTRSSPASARRAAARAIPSPSPATTSTTTSARAARCGSAARTPAAS